MFYGFATIEVKQIDTIKSFESQRTPSFSFPQDMANRLYFLLPLLFDYMHGNPSITVSLFNTNSK